MTRADYLDASKGCVCQNRDIQYGPPENSFSVIADYWSVYLKGLDRNQPISAADVGIMMALFKIGRIQTGNFKSDSYIDAIGYIACAAEIADADNSVERTEVNKKQKWKHWKQLTKQFGGFWRKSREALNRNQP